MKTPEQLKGAIRNLAKKKGIHAQEVLQIFMFERIIERLSVSSYKDRFILKGGLLISAILGVAERTTMDMDTTVKGLPMDEQSIWKAISEILDQPVDDGIKFQLLDLIPILHLLYRLYRENANWNLLKQAVLATAKKRDSLSVLQDTKRILQALEESTSLQNLWKRYQAQNLYAREITYSAVMKTVKDFAEKINCKAAVLI